MKTTALGSSSIEVSRLAYGCWRLAGEGVDGARAVRSAVESGYTLFDHADIYGGGACEEIFGNVIAESPSLRDGMVIASKCGIRIPGVLGASGPYRYDSRRSHIVESCEASLRRLKIETLDLYQIHRPDFLTHPEEVAAAFSELKSAGKVREFGVSNHQPRLVAALQRACPMKLQVQQNEFSLLNRQPLHDGALDLCLAETQTLLAWSPLGGGQLGEGAGELLTSQRSYEPARVIPLLDRIAGEHGTSRSNVALAWLLRHPARVVPIIGSTQPTRIKEAAESVELMLSAEEWYELLTAAETAPLP
ncbi:MAG TPA: aldo/keto reductase [Chthoniobacteraceae bacterium]